MSYMRAAAFVLPPTADLRAVLFALEQIQTDCAIYTQIERFPAVDVLWTVAEGSPDVDATIAAVLALLPTFGLTYTEV